MTGNPASKPRSKRPASLRLTNSNPPSSPTCPLVTTPPSSQERMGQPESPSWRSTRCSSSSLDFPRPPSPAPDALHRGEKLSYRIDAPRALAIRCLPFSFTACHESTTQTIDPNITMRELLEQFPGSQRAMFRQYHIGGCSSCGFSPDETLAGVCARNENLDVEEVDRAHSRERRCRSRDADRAA